MERNTMLFYSCNREMISFWVFRRLVLLLMSNPCIINIPCSELKTHFSLNLPFICSHSRRIWPPLFTELLKMTVFLLQGSRLPSGVTFENSILHQRTDADPFLVGQNCISDPHSSWFSVSHLSDLLYFSLRVGAISEHANQIPSEQN